MAKQVKHQAIKIPITRSALIWVGQTSHGITTRMTIWSSGYKVRSITKIEDEKALSLGADLLSESFIFSVSVGILMYEYNRSSIKEEKKEAAKLQKIRDDASKLQAKLDSLDKRLVSLEEFAKANRRSILGIGVNAEYIEPSKDEVVPINDNDIEEVNKKAESSASQGNEDSDNERSTNIISKKNHQQQTKRWWWPW